MGLWTGSDGGRQTTAEQLAARPQDLPGRRRSARNQRPGIVCRSVWMRPYFHLTWLLVRLDNSLAMHSARLTPESPAVRSYSVNCCREAQAVTDKRKPVVLLREANMAKGGISLADSMLECETRPDVRDYIFTGQQVVTWMRIQEHQLESLRQVAIGVLLTTPKYATLQQQAMQTLDLRIPGEVRLQRLRLPKPVRLCCSSANLGAAGVADELCDRLGRENVTVTIEDADSIPNGRLGRTKSSFIPNGRLGRRKSSQGAILSSFFQSQTNAFLLYLNSTTWDSADPDRREALAGHVTRARDRGESLLMVHEADLTRGGCEFGIFFQLTPQSLIDGGIYEQLAVTWFEPPHRDISIALTAKKLGAEQVKGTTIARLSAEMYRQGSSLVKSWYESSRQKCGSEVMLWRESTEVHLSTCSEHILA
mmetsp:Transcript_58723/g.154388  ORF Transcript_58723/g.154388 Transcript_58723/m.154388 type:complete len:422 (+) Transcript_58723:1884-3149(+)